MSRTVLAATVGASYEALSFWETGKRSPRAEHLAALSVALNCAIDDLFVDDDAPAREPGRLGHADATPAATTQLHQERARGQV